jgi:4-amino-4-deoxy-L-arabinose transferase-like glycosyltransferase
MATDIASATRPEDPAAAETFLVPEASSRERWIALLVFILTGLFLLAFCDYTALNGDEGIVLQGAQRVAEGQVLYRDFFSFYTPGSYYSTALLFKVFGSSLLAARIALLLSGGLFSALTYLLARRVCARWSALLAVYAVSLTCLPFRFLVTHWDATLLAYLALYSGVLWIEKGGSIWAFGTGSLAALTCLSAQAPGLGIVIGLLAGLGLIRVGGNLNNSVRKDTLLTAVAGFVWPLLLTFAYFGMKHGLGAMLADWFWPVFHYSTTNSVPYGYVVASSNGADLWHASWGVRVILLLVVGPLLIIPLLPGAAAGIFGRFAFRRGPLDQRTAYFVLGSAVLTGLLIAILVTKRADFTHLDYLAPLFYLALAWVVDGLRLQSRLWRSLMPFVVLYVFLSSTAFGMTMLSGALRAHHQIRTVRGTVRTDDADYSLDYVQANVKPGERIFVYPYEPMYYYLTGTFSPTGFDFLQLGMHTPEQFQESLAGLAADRTRVVLFETSVAEKLAWTSPDTPLQLAAARDPVAEYIFTHYRVCAGPMTNQYWRFLFMVRKDLPCTANTARYESTGLKPE